MSSAPPSWALPGLAVAAAAVLLSGSVVAVTQRSGDDGRDTASSASPSRAPSPSPAATAVPADDLKARLATPPLGYLKVSAKRVGTGELDARQLLSRQGLTGADLDREAALLTSNGFVRAAVEQWSSPESERDLFFEFMVTRYDGPEIVARIDREARALELDTFESTTVPGALTYLGANDEGTQFLYGTFTRGPYVYLLTHIAPEGEPDVELFDELLLRQRTIAVEADPS